VNPTNIMGCSKRLCEIYTQSLNAVQSTTEFVTTRFGNVLGSNGSVIPIFAKQIREGGPVTVTDPNITRFFMLIPEACELVLEAGTHGHGGQIFVFDMGQPVRIADLAKRMIKLSGATHVQIVYTGLRAGEKLYEEVLADQESTEPTFNNKIRIAKVRQYEFDEVSKAIDNLITTAGSYDARAVVAQMKAIVPEYKPANTKW
jgi:FlaA1/EpsC-like NDP-sugar epimerase